MAMIGVPFAYGLTRLGFWFGGVNLKSIPRAVFGGLLGLACVSSYQLPYVKLALLILLGLLGWHACAGRIRLPAVVGTCLLLVPIFGTVFHLNYLFAFDVADRLRDADLFATDLAAYSWWSGTPTDGRGLFPLVTSEWAFRVFENAYAILFVEVLVVVLVYVERGLPVGRFVWPMTACYVGGLVTFWFFPVVGPCIQYPESIRPLPADSITYSLMRGMDVEFDAVRHGGPLNGMAYFVAVPSLHVAMALLMQIALAPSRGHFWVMLPVNVLMALSTVVLGYHYLLDVPAGVALVAIVLAPAWVASRGRRPDRSARAVVAGEPTTALIETATHEALSPVGGVPDGAGNDTHPDLPRLSDAETNVHRVTTRVVAVERVMSNCGDLQTTDVG
jgi:membrane-associated phospholipid phosphatase